MIRLALLLYCCFTGLAYAQAQPGNGFDAEALASVQAEAIDFMLPRTLEVVTAAQLAIWALGGLASIDPAITAVPRDGGAQLLQRGYPLIEITPQGTDPTSWALAIAELVTAAWNASNDMRRAGQPAVTKALFDEMLAHIDPYSRYIPPMEAVGDRDRRVGHAGIGVALMQKGGTVIVRDVVMGSPGALAGIVPGDVIQWVDGRSARNRDRAGVEALLNGPEGTELRMGWIGRDGTTRGATLTRIMIPPETVLPHRSGDILNIQITGFSQTTDQHVAQVVRENLKGSHPINGIILDLRGNRGGLLRGAVATANLFLGDGIVVRSSGRAPGTTRIWLSGGGELAKGIRIVMLVDGGTASAAEIVAAALADRGRAVVVGSSTFGKGVVQTIDALPDGGELFLTWSRILAPRGWPIQSLGVMPQVCTSLGAESVAGQLASLEAGASEMSDAITAHREARAPLTPDEIVAIRGRCPAADPREDDLDAARSLLEKPLAYAAALLAPMQDER